jgi:hypothetical protein
VNVLTVRPDRLERLRAIALALPEAVEKETWGDPTWRVCDRIFAMQKGNYAGGRPSLWVKAAPDVQALLVESQPERFFVPPCVGAKGWAGAWLDGRRVDWRQIEDLVRESYRLIAPKRISGQIR